ncbi:beta-N-acetylhexosaminidase [Thiohalobacter sp. IOR34]|uniref:beta-N-acetylhexosaminidase n=1 Tax=Thiohalobacter sp. IOR34 TaxID=3057176 RepID=UPI00339D3846
MVLGPLMIDLQGTELTAAERERLLRPEVGGVILFSRNYESPRQLQALVESIHRLRDPHLLVAVDQEGGRVQRFRDGFTRLPPVAELGLAYDQDRRAALRLAETSGWLMAAELRAVGVDFSFAPVLDLAYGRSAVIGDRAFHRRPEAVAELAAAYQRGMQRAGMQAVGKHFPGHGAVSEDSHLALPVDTRSYADIRLADLLPFERLIHQGLAGVMAAHVVYEAVDPRAAGFSAFWLREVLRDELGFQGVIFSDDLSMVAAEVAGDPVRRAKAALAAGCDMVLVCNQPQAAEAVLDALQGHDDPAAHLRLVRMHGRGQTDWETLRASRAWREAVEAVRGYDVDPLLDMDM